MGKKLCIAVGAVVVGLAAIIFVPKVGSKAHEVYDRVSHWANDVPVERQLADLQRDMGKIDQDIKHNLGKLAALEVDYEKLDANVTAMKEAQVKQKAEMDSLATALESGDKFVKFGDRKLTPAQVKSRLETAMSNFEIRKTELKTREQLLASKRQALELAHQRISEMKEQKEKLRVTVAKLETRNEKVKMMQVDCPIEVNDSVVNKCNAKAAKIEQIISQQEKEAQLLQDYGYGNKAAEKANTERETKSKEDVLQAYKKLKVDDEDETVAVEKK